MTEMTNGDKPAARTRLDAPSYESVVAACRWATQTSGRGLLAVSESDRALRVTFSSWPRQQEALRAVLDLGYAASADNELSLVVTGWDSELLAQRADRAQVELRALEVAHREVASATLGRLRDQRTAGIVDDSAVAAAVAVVDTENLKSGVSDVADARSAWTAVPITPVEISTARGTLRAQLVNVAAAEQALVIQHNTSPAQIARSAVELFFEYRDRHGYDDHEAAGYAFADMAEGIDSAYEVAWRAVSHVAEEARAGGGHHARSVNVAAVKEHGPPAASQRSGSVEDALADLAGVFGDSMTAVEVGRHVTCTEADAIARALLAGGYRDAASQWLDGHARGDAETEEDRHVGNDFDLDTYLDGLEPRRVIIDSDARAASRSRGHDQPTAAAGERNERGTPAGAPPDLDQWAPAVRELAGSAVVEDPAWPRLAEAIDRAHAAGWDVSEGVPRLVAQGEMPELHPEEMPELHPAGELLYRLYLDCPAAVPRTPWLPAADAPATGRGPAPEAARSPQRPDVGQPPPGR